MFMHDGPIPFLFFFALSRLFWIAILIFLACLLVRWLSTRGSHWNPFLAPTAPPQVTDVPLAPHSGAGESYGQPQLSALEILDRRYASGDIDGATFEHMRERIIGSQTPDLE